jgi:DNA-directed RNA polymerase specialized sigma24 family protein
MRAENPKTIELIKNEAVDLYWLSYLLTGRREISIDIAADVAVSEDTTNRFFTEWLHSWSRRITIAKALSAVHSELAESAQRVETSHMDRPAAVPANWSLGAETTKAEIEEALLAVNLFPRAALLLLTFEGLRMADVTTLLDAEVTLVQKGHVIGLQELTANLARIKGLPDPAPSQRKCELKRLAEAPKKLGYSLRTAFARS